MVEKVAISPILVGVGAGLRSFALFLIRVYQIAISPLLPPACRFYPSCSAYMAEAIERKGLFWGFIYGIRRLTRCHPFHPGGFDPLT